MKNEINPTIQPTSVIEEKPVQDNIPLSQPAPKKNSSLNVLIIFVGALFLMGIGGLGVWAFMSKNEVKTDDEKKIVQVSPTPADETNVDENKIDETDGWNTYKNYKYGFEFMYPKSWFYQGNPESPSSLIAFFLTGSIPDFSFGDHKGNEILMLNFSESLLSAKESKEKYYQDAISFRIDGREAFRNSQLINIYSGSTKNFVVSFWRIDQAKGEIDQILSTFRFRQDKESTDWKTYADPTNTFTIDYPSDYHEEKEKDLGTPKLEGWDYAGCISKYTCGTSQEEDDIYFKFDVISKRSNEEMKGFVNRIVSERAGEFKPGDVSSSFKKYVSVGGKESLWYEGNMGPAILHTEIFVPKNDTSVVCITVWSNQASGTRLPYTSDQKILIDKMLLTFKFTN